MSIEEEVKEATARVEAVRRLLWDTLAEAEEDPILVLPALAFLTGLIAGVVREELGDADSVIAALMTENITAGLHAYNAQRGKKRKRSKGLNKRSAVKAAEDLLRG